MPITLDGHNVPLPREYAPTLLKSAFEQSVVKPLSPSQPLPLGETVIPQYDGGIEAGVVGEAQPKPVSEAAMSFKTLKPIKLATIVIVSKEAARLNPSNMLDFVNQDLQNAITRAIDLGILYGKSAKTGQDITDATFVNQTTNRVELSDSDLVPQLVAGYETAGEKSDPTGWTFDSRWRTKVALASQQQLAPAGGTSPMPDLSNSVQSFAGLPATYGRVVSGRVGANNTDTGVKGFIGDWGKVRWGFGEQITMSRSTEATVVDGENTYHLWQDNLIGLLVEATVGWLVMDPQAFAAFDSAAAGGGGE